jgi:hypothetical protein
MVDDDGGNVEGVSVALGEGDGSCDEEITVGDIICGGIVQVE